MTVNSCDTLTLSLSLLQLIEIERILTLIRHMAKNFRSELLLSDITVLQVRRRLRTYQQAKDEATGGRNSYFTIDILSL